jgi:hypothetical protein
MLHPRRECFSSHVVAIHLPIKGSIGRSYGDPGLSRRKNDALRHVSGLDPPFTVARPKPGSNVFQTCPLRDYQAMPCGMPGEAVYSYGDPGCLKKTYLRRGPAR